MNTDDADDEMSETTGMYISEDVGLVKVVEDHSVSQEEVDQVLDGEDLNAITLRGVRRKLEQLQGLQERALDHCKASITGLVVIHIENLSMRSTTDKKTKKGKKGKKDKKEEAGLLSVDRFGFTRVRYFGILSFAGLVEKPSCQNAIYCFVHQSDRNERSRDISTSYMHLFRVVPQSKYKQFFYNYASDLVGTGRLGLGLGLRAGVGVGVGHIINSRQQFA
jgi:hypothetical protein